MYRRLLSDRLTPSTVGRVHAILKQAMRDAIRDKHIRTNPLEDVKAPKQQRTEKNVLTADEVRRLLETVRGGRFEGVFVLAATCGLRIGEILALRYEDVDLEQSTLRVERTLYHGEVTAPKTSSRRTLTLPQTALEWLVRLFDGSTNPRAGYLFATASGNPLDVSNFYRWSWGPALQKADLPETLTPHQLRHGTASLLLNQNVPIPAVSRYLGHANPGVTMKVYAHVIDGTSGIAAQGIDSALR